MCGYGCMFVHNRDMNGEARGERCTWHTERRLPHTRTHANTLIGCAYGMEVGDAPVTSKGVGGDIRGAT